MRKLEEQLESDFMREEKFEKGMNKMMPLIAIASYITICDMLSREHQLNIPQMISAAASVVTYATCLGYLILHTPHLKCTDYIKSLFH